MSRIQQQKKHRVSGAATSLTIAQSAPPQTAHKSVAVDNRTTRCRNNIASRGAQLQTSDRPRHLNLPAAFPAYLFTSAIREKQQCRHFSAASTRGILINNPSAGLTITDGTYLGIGSSGTNFDIYNQEGGYLQFGNANGNIELASTGNVQFSHYGAGTLTTDASGNITAASDERLKNIQGNFTDGLAQIEQLTPILYKWKPSTGFDASTTYAGFSAQNVQANIPEAVGQGKDGFLTLQDRPLIAAAVNAIKELDQQLTDLANTVAGFADNFVSAHITATTIDADTITANNNLCIKKSDGTPVCVTGDQLAALLTPQGVSPSLPPTASPSLIPDATTTNSDATVSSTMDPASAETATTTTTDATSTAQ